MNKAPEDLTERMCIISRETLSLDDMIRFVRDPEGRLLPDLACRLPGRGVWVTARKDMVAQAYHKKAFAKGLKAQVQVEETIPDFTEQRLYQYMLEGLAMVNKAGAVVFGFDASQKMLQMSKGAVLIHAIEAGLDGAKKLNSYLGRNDGLLIMNDIFKGEDLDGVFNRSNLMHLCVERNKVVEIFMKRARRYLKYIGYADEE